MVEGSIPIYRRATIQSNIMKKQFIRDIVAGTDFAAPFRIRSLSFDNTKDRGVLYARVVLRDATGDAEAKWFDLSEEQAQMLRDLEYVYASGKAEMRSGRLNFKVKHVVPFIPAEDQLTWFSPNSFLPLDVLQERLEKYIDMVKQPFLHALLVGIFRNDPQLRRDYEDMPAAIKNHHGFRHGLLQHSLEVAGIVLHDAKMIPSWGAIKPNLDLLLTGALLHDIGKTLEYQKQGQDFTYHKWGNFLGHIVLGYQIVVDKIREIDDFPDELATLVLHMILSHHGKREYGSPVVPYFYEAELLHMADTKSAAAQHWVEAHQLPVVDNDPMQLAPKLMGNVRQYPRHVYVNMQELDHFWQTEVESD